MLLVLLEKVNGKGTGLPHGISWVSIFFNACKIATHRWNHSANWRLTTRCNFHNSNWQSRQVLNQILVSRQFSTVVGSIRAQPLLARATYWVTDLRCDCGSPTHIQWSPESATASKVPESPQTAGFPFAVYTSHFSEKTSRLIKHWQATILVKLGFPRHPHIYAMTWTLV